MRKSWNVDRPHGFRVSATIGLIGALAVSFLLYWLPGIGQQFNSVVGYNPENLQYWTLITYPFDAKFLGPVGFLFICWWLYMLGTFLEGSLGPYGFLLAFFGSALVSSILMTAGHAIGIAMPLVPTVGLPVSALTVLWGARNQSTIIRLFCLIPIMGKWVAALSAFITVISYGATSPLMGVLAGAPLLIMWLYGTNRIRSAQYGDVPSVSTAKQVKKDDREFHNYMDKVREKEQDRKEKERLRKMLESSLKEDDEDEG